MEAAVHPRLVSGLVASAIVIVLAFAFAARAGTSETTLHGTTEQGNEIQLRLDAHDRVQAFEVHVDQYCDSEAVRSTNWHPTRARFGSRGPHFDAVEVKGELAGLVRGTVSGDRAEGTVLMSRTRDGREECSSGPVRWTASR